MGSDLNFTDLGSVVWHRYGYYQLFVIENGRVRVMMKMKKMKMIRRTHLFRSNEVSVFASNRIAPIYLSVRFWMLFLLTNGQTKV